MAFADVLSCGSTMSSAKPNSPCMDAGCVSRNCPTGRSGKYDARPACCASTSVTEGVTQKERQELLWHHFFSYPWEWWDNRPEKKRSPRHPDFRHKTSKESLWLSNSDKPAWVDSQLASRDLQLARGPACGDGDQGSEAQSLLVRCEEAELSQAVEALDRLVQQGFYVSDNLISRVLKRCVAQKDLVCGKRVHSLALKRGCGSNPFLATHIIGMYASHGKLEDAVQVFSQVGNPSVYMWSSIILAHARHGQPSQAINLYRQMRESGVEADSHVFVAALKACASAEDLVSGKEVHADIQALAGKADGFVGNSLVNMYAKCGSLDEARKVFDSLPKKDVVTWTAMIAGYSQQGLGRQALAVYANMEDEGITPANHVTFVCLLQACANVEALQQGKQLHSQIRERGLEGDAVIGNCLVNMYAKCGSLEDARQVFDNLPRRDVVTWTAMIAGYAQKGLGPEALALYASMRREGITPADHVTFVCLLQAFANVGALQQGKELHSQIRERGLEANPVIGNCLVTMFAKCGSLDDARKVFDSLPRRDVVTWTAMIAGYSQQGLGREALALYASMEQEGITPANNVTFVCLLQACASVGALQQGKQIHSQVRERRLESDAGIGNSLVNMYAKCGSLRDARKVFDNLPTRDVVSWTAMIAGYSQQGLGKEALSLYASMQKEGITPADHVTFVCLLQACASAGALQQGKELHSQIRRRGLESDTFIGSCLVDMYCKCGSVDEAREVFDSLPKRDVVTWTAMISGYSQQGMGREALALYTGMEKEGITPADHVTFMCLLQACGCVGALQQGKDLHLQIRKRGLEADACIGSSLVAMYAKCGSLEDAHQVFDGLPSRNLVTWTALLNGYAEHNDGRMAIKCFEDMLQQGVQPDETTFICLLVACSHAGLVDEGRRYFRMMVDDHGIVPSDHHHSCMVDLLGRSGKLDEAEDLLRSTLFNDVVGWTALLSACKGHGDLDRGVRCFERLVELAPDLASSYVLLGNLYANAGRWDDVDRIESLRKSAGAMKKAAKACIEVRKEVHEFTVGEDRFDISSKVKTVNTRLKEEGGYVPQTHLVLKAVSEQEKEDALCGHAEKLALAYGLLNTPAGSTLVVTKNLRMCNDCHSSTKIMSRLENRDIVVRDAHRVHLFKDGACSCRDGH